jgi:glycosyltransferase involved in cell wall biosynthesis
MGNLTTENISSTLEPNIENPTSQSVDASSLCIVCLSDLFWDEHWSSEQQIMSRLAEKCRVLYVERPVSILSSLTGVSDSSVVRQWLRWLRGGVRQESANLTLLSPAPVLPLRYNRVVNKINSWLLRRSVKRALRKGGFEAPVLWIYSPDAGRLVGTLGESYSVYYCADDWAASKQWWNDGHLVRARETELAAKVDLVVGTSTNIVKRWQQTHTNTMLVTNGADVDSFKAARDPQLKLPADLQDIPSPRIGYVGCVDSRFDSALYRQLAERRPDWNFVIVGPLSGTNLKLERLREMKNVHFLGSRNRAELPAYLKGFDVCAIPYVCDTLSKSIFPLKFFEYLSAGRPIVSTALPELAPYARYVHIARDADGFESSIQASLINPLPSASDSFLAQNSWEAKAEHLWATLQQAVPNSTINRTS